MNDFRKARALSVKPLVNALNINDINNNINR